MKKITRLLASLVLACMAFAASAQTVVDRPTPTGVPFFLLTDSSYSSTEDARVRFELSGGVDALNAPNGVDVALYRVPEPLDFLSRQKDLHRIDVAAAMREESLSNTLAALWLGWWDKARKVWQQVFAANTRKAVVDVAPQLKTSKGPSMGNREPAYTDAPAFKPIAGLTLADRFRYPVQHAKPIAPPADLKLNGSSSNFKPPEKGNVYIPLGKLKPGLYVVEAAVVGHRAVTLLFVSDSVAVTKTATDQLLAWVAWRADGKPAAGSLVRWSDLNGTLASGKTDGLGVAVFKHSAPQASYVFGEDTGGGVFVSENFYFDSEIYNAKLHASTDRPLYRPGDEVFIKVYGREFTSAIQSKPLTAGTLGLTVLDAQGTPVHSGTLDYKPETGADTRFVLPANATSGGYEIRVQRGEDTHSAAFRVAPYVKPHFEVLIEPAQPSFKTGQPIEARVQLNYPDGKPVKNAVISLTARAQALTMVDGDLAYGGTFPVQLDNAQELTTNGSGVAKITLPAVKEPSRVILEVLAADGSAQRVRGSKELLVERAAASYTLRPQRQFAAAGETVAWKFAPAEGTPIAADSAPVQWTALHQESQTRTEGTIATGAKELNLKLDRPGSYMIELRDKLLNITAASPFWVAGGELKPPQGSIEIVFDQPRYKAGAQARALVTFPVAVSDALITLERDRVESYASISQPGSLAKARKLNDRQWEVLIDVKGEFAPNITFSVAYVQGHEFGFQNAGIAVEQPRIDVAVISAKAVWQPGETVTLDLLATSAGQPVSAALTLAVVDEMVYALQPEIAPTLQDFFYHPRRNNVRTHSSLSFISYDEAVDATLAATPRRAAERSVKLMERPRRDDRDTALWAPVLMTDAKGRAQVKFVMPDALTRWRVTARAVGQAASDGLVGDKRAFIQSDKEIFAKWTSANWARLGDAPQINVAVFNQAQAATSVQVTLAALGDRKIPAQTRKLDAKPGVNYLTFELPALAQGSTFRVDVARDGQKLDTLDTPLATQPNAWRSEREMSIALAPGVNRVELKLPADAQDVRLQVAGTAAQAWARVSDSLLDYPYGCVEQTASRMIPLSLALNAMPQSLAPTHPMRQQLYSSRLRLSMMAGPGAVFGWWGNNTAEGAFLSAYAYYADYSASRTLKLDLPPQHWENLLTIYRKSGANDGLAQRAMALWMMREMELPVGSMVEGLIGDLVKTKLAPAVAGKGGWLFGIDGAADSTALVLTAHLAQQLGKPWPAMLNDPLATAQARLGSSSTAFAQTLLLVTGKGRPELAQEALLKTSVADPTFDRAMALAWLAKATKITSPDPVNIKIAAPWRAGTTSTGQAQWTLPGDGAGAKLPADVAWEGAAPADANLSVRYSSYAPDAGNLPMTIKRQLFMLEREGTGYRAKAVTPGDGLRTDALYLDEVVVDSPQAQRFGLLEVGLPPGAFMEPSTWGIRLLPSNGLAAPTSAASVAAEPNNTQAGGNAAPQGIPLERAIGEVARDGYRVPLDRVEGTRVVRHLVRFGQRGSFGVPPVRYWRMYQPQDKAVQASAPARWKVE